jgi:hypothetical protein
MHDVVLVKVYMCEASNGTATDSSGAEAAAVVPIDFGAKLKHSLALLRAIFFDPRAPEEDFALLYSAATIDVNAIDGTHRTCVCVVFVACASCAVGRVRRVWRVRVRVRVVGDAHAMPFVWPTGINRWVTINESPRDQKLDPQGKMTVFPISHLLVPTAMSLRPRLRLSPTAVNSCAWCRWSCRVRCVVVCIVCQTLPANTKHFLPAEREGFLLFKEPLKSGRYTDLSHTHTHTQPLNRFHSFRDMKKNARRSCVSRGLLAN